jgi:hypothetical protein
MCLFFIFIFATCRKTTLPGPNDFYFQCKIDGRTYVPNSCANCITCTIYKDTIFIFGGNAGFETVGVGINDNSGIKVYSYTLNNVIGRRGDYKNSTVTYDRYFTDSNRTGQLDIISLDKTNRIIQGTFYFKAYNAYRNDSVNVTDGKFRLKYTTN